ncbi:hypothetical protein B0H19DRAFT_1077760 [Mycena capillaripes]|nr:hypothetical protein B0H19DRAFT_1077760 [Mycena capillaripes]
MCSRGVPVKEEVSIGTAIRGCDTPHVVSELSRTRRRQEEKQGVRRDESHAARPEQRTFQHQELGKWMAGEKWGSLQRSRMQHSLLVEKNEACSTVEMKELLTRMVFLFMGTRLARRLAWSGRLNQIIDVGHQEDERSIKRHAAQLRTSRSWELASSTETRSSPSENVAQRIGARHLSTSHGCGCSSVDWHCSELGCRELDVGDGRQWRAQQVLGMEYPGDIYAQDVCAGRLRHGEDPEKPLAIARCPAPCFSASLILRKLGPGARVQKPRKAHECTAVEGR